MAKKITAVEISVELQKVLDASKGWVESGKKATKLVNELAKP